MKTLQDIFDCWESLAQMAHDVGESHWVVVKWRRRRSIPSTAWPAVIEALERKGKHISADILLKLHTAASTSISPLSKPHDGVGAA